MYVGYVEMTRPGCSVTVPNVFACCHSDILQCPCNMPVFYCLQLTFQLTIKGHFIIWS